MRWMSASTGPSVAGQRMLHGNLIRPGYWPCQNLRRAERIERYSSSVAMCSRANGKPDRNSGVCRTRFPFVNAFRSSYTTRVIYCRSTTFRSTAVAPLYSCRGRCGSEAFCAMAINDIGLSHSTGSSAIESMTGGFMSRSVLAGVRLIEFEFRWLPDRKADGRAPLRI